MIPWQSMGFCLLSMCGVIHTAKNEYVLVRAVRALYPSFAFFCKDLDVFFATLRLNFYMGKRAADEGRSSIYPSIDFCALPAMRKVDKVANCGRYIIGVTGNMDRYNAVDLRFSGTI